MFFKLLSNLNPISMRKFSLAILLFPLFASCQRQSELDKKIGQMILIGFPGREADPLLLKDIKAGKAGAIIYFEKNLPLTNTVEAVTKMNAAFQKASPTPLLICIDQEGGKVNRLKTKYGFPRSVTAAYIGKTKSLDTVRYYANTTAANLASIGFNVNFAPVVDLAINTENTVIAKPERSYSRHPDSVVLYASEVVKEHRKNKVLSALKHFPGHGSSKDDTHFGVADVTDTWIEDELKPYRTMLAAGNVDAVMTSHIVNKYLDPKGLPGTLSKRIIDGLLRKKIGYNGVVFSDDMQMQAIAKHFTLEETIKLAINAGVDIMCFSNNIPGSEARTVDVVHQIIKKMIETGEIKKERIDESYGRIMAMKKKLAQRN
jgi:beta-N-acetylhexosaminidase